MLITMRIMKISIMYKVNMSGSGAKKDWLLHYKQWRWQTIFNYNEQILFGKYYTLWY